MKKKLILAMVASFALFITACGSNTSELDALKKENEELKAQIEQLQSTENIESKNSDEASLNAEDNTAQSDDVAQFILNKPFLVETDQGSYNITITGAKSTDWYERSGKGTDKTIVLLCYEVENIDFTTGTLTSDGKDGVLVDQYAFKVSDENNYILNMDNSTYSDCGFPDIVEPGYKTKEELPYIVDGKTSTINVVLSRRTGDVAKITLDVTE